MSELPRGISSLQLIQSVDWAIKNRRTEKVLLDSDELQDSFDGPPSARFESSVTEAIAVSGWAPFHYDRRADDLAEPWRFYRLGSSSCRTLSKRVLSLADDVRPQNKIPKMLMACGSLVLVTWLPEESISDPDKLEEVNHEHVAATAAAIQNLLLALTTRGLGSYWSSGGILRQSAVLSHLGIDSHQRLLAAVFIDDLKRSESQPCDRIPGKNRLRRSPNQQWCRDIDLE